MLGFFHQVGGHDDGNFFPRPQLVQVKPQIAASTGIEPCRRLIQQQHARPMHESFGQFHTALHSAGKCFNFVFRAISKSNTFQHFLNA